MQAMQIGIDGLVVDRKIAYIARTIQGDGSSIECPEPLLEYIELVFRRDYDSLPVIVATTTPA